MSFNLTSLQECLDGNSPFCKIDIEDEKSQTNENSVRNANNYKSNLEEIYTSIIEYVGDLMMTKHKQMGSFCAYTAKINCQLSYGCRLVVVVIPDDGMPMGSIRPLHTLHWLNLQTRYSTQELTIKPSSMPETKNKFVSTMIERVHRDDKKTVYKVNGYPDVRLTLFKKKDSIQDWSERNKLYVALQTFCCSIDIV